MSLGLRKCVALSSRLVSRHLIARSLNSSAGSGSRATKNLAIGLCAGVPSIAAAAYLWKSSEDENSILKKTLRSLSSVTKDDILKALFASVAAQKKKGRSIGPCGGGQKKTSKAACLEPQQNVITPVCGHSLYLWITLDSCADQCEVARVASDIDGLLCSLEDCDGTGTDDIIIGVGFGPTFYSQVMGKTCKNFYYACRKCCQGELPSTGGDILLHVKCNDRGKLFEICRNYLYSFPESSIREYEDIYGYDYKCGRDLSNFCINVSTPQDEEGMKEAAVECETGGSYAMAMKWMHDFSVMRPENKNVLEKYIGRDMNGDELKCKTETCHVTRMRGSSEEGAAPCFEVVQQSMGYGSLSKGAGLFFCAFSKDPASFEFMLDRMVGSGCDGCVDDLFRISKNVKGTYFFFPGQDDLASLKNAGK